MAKLPIMTVSINPWAYWIILTPIIVLIGVLLLIGIGISFLRLLFRLLGPSEWPKPPSISKEEFRDRIKQALKDESEI
jgi:hypothetical protein